MIIDSNVFIASFRSSEIQHPEAFDLLKKAKSITITTDILSEIYTVMLNRDTYEIAKMSLEKIIYDPKINIEIITNDVALETINFLREHPSTLSFIDASLIVMSKSRNIPLITFDQEILKYC